MLRLALNLAALCTTAVGRGSSSSLCHGVTDDEPGCVVTLDGAERAAPAAELRASTVGNCTNGWQFGPPSSKTLSPCVCDPRSFGCPTVDPPFNLSGVQFAGSFLSGMVLQRGPGQSAVFGTAPPGAAVTVHITHADGWSYSGHSTASTLPAAELRNTWKVLLPPRPAGAGYTITAKGDDGSAQRLDNVSFGDIWFCTGQVRPS